MESTAKITKSIRTEDVEKKWIVVDASNQTLGRLSTQVARILRGKHKPSFTPHVECGDFVIVINAEKIQVKGKREAMKEYFHHSTYPGGVKIHTFKNIMATKPEFAIQHAVRGMLPKNRLGRQIIKNLKVYAGEEHPHAAQQPEMYTLKYN